jgi:hypothetical protein
MNEAEILKQFRDLQSEIREDKVKLESEPIVSSFVERLFDRAGWTCYFHVLANCVEKNSLIYYSTSSLPKDKLVELLTRAFTYGSGFFADILSKYLSNFENGQSGSAPSPLDVFQSFVDQDALRLLNECLEYCSVCDELKIVEVQNRRDDCGKCSSKLFHIMQASLPEPVRASITNGQLLEIYAKKCLQRSGFRVITKTVNNTDVSTSIPYRVYGSDIEIDVGAVKNSSLVLIECKTGKLVPNDVAQKLAQYKLLIDTLKKRMSGLPDLHVRFLVLGEVDKNVDPKAYESVFAEDLNLKTLEVADREQVIDLTNYMSDLRKKL